jgi:hypothetical protein
MKKQKQGYSNLSLPFTYTASEKLLQFIWNFGYYNNANLTTTEGEEIAVVFRGTNNTNQGPDFANAKIRIGATTLAGSVELHSKTSEWKKHKHENDPNYKTVILHVVFEHDEKVNEIPVLELGSRISNLLLERYSSFMENVSFIPCGNSLPSIKELVLTSWKERLLAERLTRKSAYVLELFQQSNNHWEETFWWLLARNMGSAINSDAFEALARTIPVNIIAKHKASIHQLEALLFGQANLLASEFEDEYARLLQREYLFLKKKYNLQTSLIPVLFLRMRPGNFPTIRLAQLAMLLQQSTHLFSTVLQTEKLDDIKKLFAVTANDFWHYHYNFQQVSSFKPKKLGTDTIHHLIINTLVPVIYAYGVYHKEEKYQEKALRWLEELPAESNNITAKFVEIGLKNTTAYDSQALIELKNEYCNEKKCLDCSIGNHLLKEAGQVYKVLNPA